MYDEIISLLTEAYEAGIITTVMQSQIDAVKHSTGITEEAYKTLEDGVRIGTYIRKVKEREKKGVTFMGDLRKQYRITEDDKPLIEERWNIDPKKSVAAPVSVPAAAPKSVPAPAPKSAPEAAPKTPPAAKSASAAKKSDVLSRSEELKNHAPDPSIPAPKRSPAAASKPAPAPAPAPVPAAAPLILVADDNETQLFLTRKTLEEYGYQCVTADTPETAVRIIAEKQPALVLCDINFGIGKPTGLDIFTNTRTKKFMMPFILVSAFIQKEFKDHAKRIGVTEYITKPTEPEELAAIVKKYVK